MPCDLLYAIRYRRDRVWPIWQTPPSMVAFRGTGGATSEQGADSAVPHAYALVDPKGRIAVLTTHNTDFGDAYEREGDDPEYFYKFSVEGYAAGINILLYTMTH